MLFEVAGWILWGCTALMALLLFAMNSADGGVRWLQRCQGFILVLGVGITALTSFSKFHLLWIGVMSFVAPMFLMSLRFSRAAEAKFHRERSSRGLERSSYSDFRALAEWSEVHDSILLSFHKEGEESEILVCDFPMLMSFLAKACELGFDLDQVESDTRVNDLCRQALLQCNWAPSEIPAANAIRLAASFEISLQELTRG